MTYGPLPANRHGGAARDLLHRGSCSGAPLSVRRMPRWLWATAIICLPLAGSVCWLFLGRPNAKSLGMEKKQDRPKAPDDDVDFLRGL